MREFAHNPNIRELSLPLVRRQFACAVEPMGGWSGSKNPPLGQ
ncbi:hypothetical protein EDB98_106173 [Pseudomonas fluorescens]|nr:hypothetical protein EDB98_106173 [Pseudomonas fluorescens]